MDAILDNTLELQGNPGPKGDPGAPGVPGPVGVTEPPKVDVSKLALPEKKTVTKELFDKTASELAEAKRQLRERMTAEELSAAKAEEARMELETLRRAAEVSKLEIALAKSGVENSAEIAELFANGEIGQGIAALSKAKDKIITDLKKQLTLAEQRGALTPPVGEPNSDFAGKSIAELMQMANQNPAMEQKIAAYLAAQHKKE